MKEIGKKYIFFLQETDFYFWDISAIVFLPFLSSPKPSYIPLLAIIQIHGPLCTNLLHVYMYTQILRTRDMAQGLIACLVYERP